MSHIRARTLAAVFAGALLSTTSFAQQAGESAPAEAMTAAAFLDSLSPHTGKVTLPGGVAELDLPGSFYYLPPEDTERVLVDAWGNPSGGGSLGMLVPSAYSVLDDEAWAVIISYEEDGHVADDDALELDYAELLAQMQEQVAESNAARIENGYEPVTLVGWATQPRYDSTTKKMYWAKELRFGQADANTLNYNVRVLGRKGVLVLNMVASMSQLNQVEAATPTVLAMTDFTQGNRYADFDPDIDEVAAYGIGALIAGKLATKAGLFAKLGVLLLALKKFWFVLLIGAWFAIKRLFGRGATT